MNKDKKKERVLAGEAVSVMTGRRADSCHHVVLMKPDPTYLR